MIEGNKGTDFKRPSCAEQLHLQRLKWSWNPVCLLADCGSARHVMDFARSHLKAVPERREHRSTHHPFSLSP